MVPAMKATVPVKEILNKNPETARMRRNYLRTSQTTSARVASYVCDKGIPRALWWLDDFWAVQRAIAEGGFGRY